MKSSVSFGVCSPEEKDISQEISPKLKNEFLTRDLSCFSSSDHISNYNDSMNFETNLQRDDNKDKITNPDNDNNNNYTGRLPIVDNTTDRFVNSENYNNNNYTGRLPIVDNTDTIISSQNDDNNDNNDGIIQDTNLIKSENVEVDPNNNNITSTTSETSPELVILKQHYGN